MNEVIEVLQAEPQNDATEDPGFWTELAAAISPKSDNVGK
jgi:hypothetical protein